MAKANATKKYRATAWTYATAAIVGKPPRWKAATVHVVYFFKDARKRDRDGLLSWLKAAFDGIADSGVVGNDADFTYMPILIAKDTKRPRVEVEIVRAE